MAKHQELISIVVPCYNHAQFLAEAVKSVIDQSHENWECIIVDDGSTDNTGEVSRRLVETDPRVRYYKKNNGGLSSARNYGVHQSTGTFILPLDADDIIHKDYIVRALQAFSDNPGAKIVYCEAELFEGKTGKWDLPDFTIRQLARQNMIFCSAIYRKSEWTRVGGYDEALRFGSEDWDFWISLLKNGGEVIKLPFVGFYYRIRPESMLRTLDETKLRAISNYICKKHFDFIVEQLGNPVYLSFEVDYLKKESGNAFSSLQNIQSNFFYRMLHKLRII
jgi:glycosyltransferase involved in cell wall biosynthesis